MIYVITDFVQDFESINLICKIFKLKKKDYFNVDDKTSDTLLAKESAMHIPCNFKNLRHRFND